MLNVGVDSLVHDSTSQFANDLTALEAAHITELNVVLDTTATNGDHQATLNAFASGEIATLGAQSAAAHAHGVGYELEVGQDHTVHISESQAAALSTAGLEFQEHDHITVDATHTHLQNSLKDLEKLGVDSVRVLADEIVSPHLEQTYIGSGFGDDVSNHVELNLFGAGESVASLSSVINASMPDFDHKADITLDLDNTNDDLSSDLTQLKDEQGLTDSLVNSGVDHLAIHEALGLNSTWLHQTDLSTIYGASAHQLNFDVKLTAGEALNPDQIYDSHTNLNAEYALSQSALSFDAALADVDFGYAYDLSHDKYGDLIKALTESGVHEFVVDSGNVSIGDELANALVDAGMLQALPAANLVLDASQDMAIRIADLSITKVQTSLEAMGHLGVDGIAAGSNEHLFIQLGIPYDHPDIMQDIHELLGSLDPANHAKPLAFDSAGKPVEISLVLSDQTAAEIAKDGGFTATDLMHMGNLGIKDVYVVSPEPKEASEEDEKANSADSAQKLTAVGKGLITEKAASDANELISKENSDNPSSAPAALPEVKVIGHTEPLSDILDPMQWHNK